MTRMRIVPVIAMILVVALAGCETGAGRIGAGTAIGGLGGAAAGGLLGASLGGGATGIAAGTLIGGLVGAGVGQVLDQRSQQLQAQTVGRALESTPAGTTSTWVNPDNGNRGSVTPVRTFQNPSGAYCREFQQSVVAGGQTQDAVSTACRQPDGSWRPTN